MFHLFDILENEHLNYLAILRKSNIFCKVFISNIQYTVSSKKANEVPLSEVVFFDVNEGQDLAKTSFQNEVISVKLRKDKIFVICINNIYVLNLKDFQIIDCIDTFDNPKGLLGIDYENRCIISYPYRDKQGIINIKNYDRNTYISFFATEKKEKIGYIEIKGEVLVVANEIGTMIYLYDTGKRTLLQKFKRYREH